MSQQQGTWSEATLAGHACDIFEPPHRNPHGYAVMYLHGVHLARLNEETTFTQEFARLGLPVLAPRTQRSWWTDKICAEFDPHMTAERYVLDHALPLMAELWGSTPPRVALLGTSMGGQGALRLAFKHPNKFPIVAALAPAIDYYQRFDDEDEETLPLMYPDAESARQDSATLHVHPLNWPRNIYFACDPADHRWYDSSERLQMKLYSLGIPHQHDLTSSAGGHGWAYYRHMATDAMRFVSERLEQERTRLQV